ncbi:amidohydrolase family protein [Candidatus Woesearchaeota archaeon]|jgi:uncharacterized protein|nr:amidohydrolase family protein [Candidatus Woesearchaeota archaeon]MBT3538394.1 amidohydrolase family protein [Candidatus Woesearchaeota archaeon]MBT4697061.1 amidohydrolase family protein [Candidatus Woesearchaeota archaeon]MBT4716387.1 amidohydrolase family protein [Candidatus Woesearchaeota archaeon]MBT7106063.1 amidohydrolase family protein [Candidatus Woesearchaeota archaeon]
MKIIDCHAHIGKEGDKNIDLAKIKIHLKRNKINKVVLFPFISDTLTQDSLKILELSKKNKFIIPFIRFNPNTITKKELEKLLDNPFKGVKLHPRAEKFNPLDQKFDWIFKEIQKHNIPILFHCKSYHFDPDSHPEKILKLAKRHPKQIFILGHFAGVNKELFKEYVKQKNIYVETSIDVTPNAYREVVLKYGFKRLLFGTDFPYSFGEIELMKLKFANLGKEMEERILYKNAENLLNKQSKNF